MATIMHIIYILMLKITHFSIKIQSLKSLLAIKAARPAHSSQVAFLSGRWQLPRDSKTRLRAKKTAYPELLLGRNWSIFWGENEI